METLKNGLFLALFAVALIAPQALAETQTRGIASAGGIIFHIDEDADGNETLTVRNGSAATVFTVAETGNVTATGSLSATSILAAGLKSDADVTIDIDDDSDGNNSFIVRDGDDNVILNLDEAGVLRLVDALVSNGDLTFQVDADNDSANSYIFKNGGGTTILSVNESGNLVVTGTLDVTGAVTVNDVVQSPGAVTLQVDSDDNVGNETLDIKNSSDGAMATFEEDGDLILAGDLTVDTYVNGTTDVIVRIDSDADGNNAFYIKNGANENAFAATEAGDLIGYGDFIGGYKQRFSIALDPFGLYSDAFWDVRSASDVLLKVEEDTDNITFGFPDDGTGTVVFRGAVSDADDNCTASTLGGHIRVKVGNDWGYIPIYRGSDCAP